MRIVEWIEFVFVWIGLALMVLVGAALVLVVALGPFAIIGWAMIQVAKIIVNR